MLTLHYVFRYDAFELPTELYSNQILLRLLLRLSRHLPILTCYTLEPQNYRLLLYLIEISRIS